MNEPASTVEKYARKLSALLAQVVPSQPTEADFRRPVDQLLDEFCEVAGVQPMSHTEYTVASGRADAVFNRLIIEYKRPGVLGPNLTRRAVKDATDQLVGYMTSLAQRERHVLPRMGGAVFDGTHVIFVRVREGRPVVEEPVPADLPALSRLLHWMVALSSGIALTPENLVNDFSIDHVRTQRILRPLKHALDEALANGETLAQNLFRQWQLFFSESIDYQEAFGGRKLEGLRKFAYRAGIRVGTAEDAERFFFVLHTYFALLVKLLAWLALSRHLGAKLGGPAFGQLASLDDDELRRELDEMESGGIFRHYGLVNLLEGDFFVWYLQAWNDKVAEALRDLLNRLDDYDPTTLTIHPEETRDLFKKLYHYLLPREVRHNLGEYYTPDWLAQRVLTQVNNEFFIANPSGRSVQDKLRRQLRERRWLDPACGSGTFLILIIRRYIELGRELMVHEADLLEWITSNIVGFDLNPLAVVTARVNYLLAIADLLEHRRGEVTVPVYLADSILAPSRGQDLFGVEAYHARTSVGTLTIPESVFLADFDRFCVLLEEGIRAGVSARSFMSRVERELGIALTRRTAADLQALYERLQDLHRRGFNGLWARVLKNNFAPLTEGRFDYVVGNPPWVNWENLPEGYRSETKPIWQHYGLFPHGGMDAILGKGKKDISMLMIYVVCDALLKHHGRVGFVITQSVFKTSGAGQGFRRFALPGDDRDGIPLRVVHVDDMVALNPFEGASNRTAIIILEKGRPTSWPVSYTVWHKPKGVRLTYDSTLEEVRAVIRRSEFVATPVREDDPTSSWVTAPRKATEAIRKLLGPSAYEAHAGAYSGGANAVYWVEVLGEGPDGLVVVRNVTEGGKVKVKQVTEAIEPDLLYPLLRGRDVRRWWAEPSACILMVQDPVRRCGINEEELQQCWPRTHRYLKRFEAVLRARRSRGVSDMLAKGAPFYTIFAVGDYTFAPWKVVWKEMADSLTCAVVGSVDGKAVVPDHKVMLIGFGGEEEAFYVAAALNSAPARLLCLGYTIGVQMDPHIAENIAVPAFDRSDLHLRLAELSQAAHEATAAGDKERVAEIEAEIDKLAAKLWGLTEKELEAIRKALEIMS